MSCMGDQMYVLHLILPECFCRKQRKWLHVASRAEREEGDAVAA